MKRTLPVILSFVFGVIAIAVTVLRPEKVQTVSLALSNTWQIIFACGLLAGVVAFFMNVARRIKRKEDLFFDAVLLVGALIMPILALLDGIAPGSLFMWMFENIQAPMQSTVFALLAFFVASASFRGMRGRNAPAVVLLITAFIVILGRLPEVDSLWPAITDLVFWIREFPSSAAKAGLLVGVGLGFITTTLRVILGVERPYLGGR
ncbi:hypothetical protein JYU03_00125 [bacterium AH-315-F03]|nr:hypothetical protein [bacterium AH-315-F03]